MAPLWQPWPIHRTTDVHPYVTLWRCDSALRPQRERSRSQQAMIAWRQTAGASAAGQGRKPAEPVARSASLDGRPRAGRLAQAIMAKR
jgi:hypothetical protein